MTEPNPETTTETAEETPQIPRYTPAQLETMLADGTFEADEAQPEEKLADEAKPESEPEQETDDPKDARIRKLEKMAEDARVWNAKRDNEIGQLRKENAEARKLLSEFVQGKAPSADEEAADFFTDPKKALRAELESLESEKRQKEEDAQRRIEENKALIKEWDPEIDESNIRLAMSEDVKDEAQIDAFVKEQIYKAPVLAVLLNRAGKYKKQIDALKAELEKAKAETSGKIKKIAAAAKAPHGTSGKASANENSNEPMTLEQIKAALSKHRKRG